MSCFQSEQRADTGFYTANEEIARLQDKLTGALIGLARAIDGNEDLLSNATGAVTVEALAATVPDAKCSRDALLTLLERVDQEKRKLVPGCYNCLSPCGRTSDYDMAMLRRGDEEVRALRLTILDGIRSIAARGPADRDASVYPLLYQALFALGMDDWGVKELQHMALRLAEKKTGCD